MSNQQSNLGMNLPQDETTVERYILESAPEPIRGFPEIRWSGKRPYTFTSYYPAQLKEVYGRDLNRWRNKVYWGDNLQVMSHLLKDYRGKFDLIYIDPPFDSKADYKKTITLRGRATFSDLSSFEEKQYTDIWIADEYLQYMFERLILMRGLLADSGSILIHLGGQVSHYVKCLADEVFGRKNFRNEIILPGRAVKNLQQQFDTIQRLQVRHDVLLWYSKRDETRFKPFWVQKHNMGNPEGHWHHFWSTADRPTMRYELLGITPSSGQWVWRKERALEAIANYERYLSEAGGRTLADYWRDTGKSMEFVRGSPDDGNPQYWREPAEDRIGDTMWSGIPIYASKYEYPTEKNLALLYQVLDLASEPGQLVGDFFLGSGTTLDACLRLGRRFIGADINLGAIQTATRRFVDVSQELESLQLSIGVDEQPMVQYLGLEIHNVNYYDVFRNPVEAKDLLLQALEVQRFDNGNLFDGEKDGRMVKLMPVNRIATREDINELIAGFDYRAFERRKLEHPNQPVEKITLVCMGHEPDLAATLKNEVNPYNIDVQVVDILRDKQNLQFKRDSEAKIAIRDGHLIVEAFYPMNLLQKLSLQQENVTDWRELVESIMVDWNYDGVVLEPKTVDIPDKDELVAGRYAVRADAGTIRVKITDLLSESWEGEVHYG